MGWFWADPATPQPAAPKRRPSSNREPPPRCPMHKDVGSKSSSTSQAASSCPYKPASESSSTASSHASPSYISKLNPFNYMPTEISNTRDSTSQSINLPLDREASTIPRGDGSGTWEYPSPQQMYNAMLRKGYTDTPAEHVEAMVAVHNFLNEGAWEEIKGWEQRFASGLANGWNLCSRGEAGFAERGAIEALQQRIAVGAAGMQGEHQEAPNPKLVRFMGRPNEPSPRARMLSFMAWLYPSKFPDNPPFDRHDWYVERQLPDGQTKVLRYVIDYYSGPPEPSGEPVFYLDVRPALDGPTAACERMIRWGGDVWWRASGGSVREELAKQTK